MGDGINNRELIFFRNFMIPAPILVGIELNPGPALSEEKRQNIILLKQLGFSNKDVARKLGVTVATVRKWWKKFNKRTDRQPQNFKNSPGQGRKRKLTRKQEKQVVKKAKKKDAPQIAADIGGVEAHTVRRTLLDHGLKYLVRKKVEKLTKSQEEKRLDFATKRLHDTWKYALFTDEKTWHVGSTKRKSWQDPHNREVDEIKRHPAKLHVWGGIGLHFKTDLYFFTENLNSSLFCKILKKRLPPSQAFGVRGKETQAWILVQDNDPKHKSKRATELLDRIAPDRLADWCSNSPDFNPIEDVWSIMDHQIQKVGPKNVDQLKSALKKAWKNLDMQHVIASINSLPRRFQECIDLKGARTSY